MYAPDVEIETADEAHAPDEQVAVPLWLPIDHATARSPTAVPHVPPIEVTFALVKYGKLTAAPFTFVTVTTGGVVS